VIACCLCKTCPNLMKVGQVECENICVCTHLKEYDLCYLAKLTTKRSKTKTKKKMEMREREKEERESKTSQKNITCSCKHTWGEAGRKHQFSSR
jgi:hypothetical protein